MMNLKTLQKLFKKKEQKEPYIEKYTECDECKYLEECKDNNLLINISLIKDKDQHFMKNHYGICRKFFEKMRENYYIQQGKCDFCDFYSSTSGGKAGKDIKIKPCTNETDLTECTVIKHRDDEKWRMEICSNGMAKGYIEIDFCPICGGKLN